MRKRVAHNNTLIPGLGPIEEKKYHKLMANLSSGGEMTIVNIICPGYKKSREVGVEEFDFKKLSDEIEECPNVRLMIEKMVNITSAIKRQETKGKVKIVMIFADVAILNFDKLNKSQDVKKTLDRFFSDIKKKYKSLQDIDFVKMSELGEGFEKIPLGGIRASSKQINLVGVEKDVKKRAEEYVGSLVFQRLNLDMSTGLFEKRNVQRYVNQARREVARFVVEYGYAGQAIRKLYKNSVILFTEPSGYLRGYFYHSFLKKKDRMPVLYTT